MNKIITDTLSGCPIIFPTDTVYALSCIPDIDSLNLIYRIKKRDKNKKIIALLSNIDMIKEITPDTKCIKIAKEFMPGALTIIVKSNEKFKKLTGDTVGFRIPNSPFAIDLISKCGGILMTTSANISGEKSPVNFNEISEDIKKQVKNIIVNDENLSGIPSTIISCIDDNYKLLREGEIKYIDIIRRINIES